VVDGPNRIPLSEACHLLHRSDRTVRSWLARGELSGMRQGKAWLVDRPSLDALCVRLGYVPTGSAADPKRQPLEVGQAPPRAFTYTRGGPGTKGSSSGKFASGR